MTWKRPVLARGSQILPRARTFHPLMRALVLVVGMLLVPGCFYPFCVGYSCEPCLPDLTLTVTDRTTGGYVDGVVTSAGACARQPCPLYPGAGEHRLSVEAPGYVAEQVAVTIVPSTHAEATCCRCETTPVLVDIALMPLL